MNIKLFKSKLQGEISSPPSKSYSHRYLIAAMLSNKWRIAAIFISKSFGCVVKYSYLRGYEKHIKL